MALTELMLLNVRASAWWKDMLLLWYLPDYFCVLWLRWLHSLHR